MRFRAFLALTIFVICSGQASAQSPVDLGSLSCSLAQARNFILVSKMDLDCTFIRIDGGKEKYQGRIQRVGVDLSIRKNFVVVWNVILSGNTKNPGSLAGEYAGVGADVSLIVGPGARVLVGGGDDAITLKPLSITGVRGTGASLGVESFVLSPAS